ncbi:MAG: 50S ribosomal protein L32 [Candidatus Aminicenantes bacterium]|nr:50S ribosomal protein L32 [Candidatus Aminicenantes bacterium]
MPNPKRRHSHARKGRRRSHDGIAVPSFAGCPNCGTPKLPHKACPECGFYRGRQVIKETES